MGNWDEPKSPRWWSLGLLQALIQPNGAQILKSMALRHTYNMYEKAFMIGIVSRSKFVSSKAIYQQKSVLEVFQDGNREWLMLLACVCADSTALSPGLLSASQNGTVQSAWVDSIQANEHSILFLTITISLEDKWARPGMVGAGFQPRNWAQSFAPVGDYWS
jgi:hypothetical protein